MDGTELFHQQRIYMPQAGDGSSAHMVLGPDKKLGLLRDTSIQPMSALIDNFEIPLQNNQSTVTIEVKLSYQPRPGNVYPIHTIVKEIYGVR